MSSIKDIMDVDVDPLESQAYRRSREATHKQASRSSIALPSETPSPALDDDNLPTSHDSSSNLHKGKGPVKRRKSTRISSPSSQSRPSKSKDLLGGESPTGDNAMDFPMDYQMARSSQASSSRGAQQTQTAPETPSDIPIRYTPVTKRISRAKKGVPVHTCNECTPARKFSRAEHLRRHQKSHSPPEFACTVENCEHTFHRQDLLMRHMLRHEAGSIQGTSPSDQTSMSSPMASDRQPPSPQREPQGREYRGYATPPNNAATSPAPGSAETPVIISNCQPGFSTSPLVPHKRSVAQSDISGPDTYPLPPTPGGPPVGLEHLRSGFTDDLVDLAGLSSGLGGYMYPEAQFQPSFPQPPYLTIPDGTPPTLSYNHDNSSWCSSATESTLSNTSETSVNGQQLMSRGRSRSTADWPGSATSPWSARSISATPQSLQEPQFDPSFLDHFEAPLMTSPTNQIHQLNTPSPYTSANHFMELVGTPTLSPYNKSMSQVFSASPSRVPEPRLAGITSSSQKEQLAVVTVGIPAISDCQTQTQQDIYIGSYWQHFHPHFPIIHHQTSEPIKDSLLASAMAAIGTQYHNTPKARAIGTELNDSCKRSIDHCPTWTLQTMQAILLTEIFGRFRGRKTTVRLSRHFEELYGRLLKGTGQSYKALESSDISARWLCWSEIEARKRLLSACFIFDVQQALFHQQARSKALGGESRPFLPSLCSDNLWNANTPMEWQAHQAEYPPDQPSQLLEQTLYSQATYPEPSNFRQSLLMCFLLATRLPMRESPDYPDSLQSHAPDSGIANLMDLFPNSLPAQTYLALNQTPLHDLLAVAGDTWVFNQKLTPLSAFHDAQLHLKTWSSSLAAAQAVHHACRILSLGFSAPDTQGINRAEGGIVGLSDYWGLYVAALICWAFGYRYQNSSSTSGNPTRNNSSITSNETDADSRSHVSAIDAQFKPVTYINAMLELNVEDLLTNRASMKGDTAAIIDAVRHRLELEDIGGSCGMLVDCIGVLNKLSNTPKRKCF